MSALRVRGGATADEVAAVLAVLADRDAPVEHGYPAWRAARRRALARTHPGHFAATQPQAGAIIS